MSVDLDAIAGNFKCSVEDVKVMLGGITAELPDYIAIVDGAVGSADFSTIIMAVDMIKGKINHFNLSDMENALASLEASASASDKAGCESAFAALNGAMAELSAKL